MEQYLPPCNESIDDAMIVVLVYFHPKEIFSEHYAPSRVCNFPSFVPSFPLGLAERDDCQGFRLRND